MGKMIAACLLLTAMTMAVPPPPWFLDGVRQGEIDFTQYLESYRDAVSRGVDAGNPIYGPGHPPFGPNGTMASTDGRMNVLILLVDFSDNVARTKGRYFDHMGFDPDTFSLSNYYGEVSFGQIDIITVNWPSETGWERVPETYSYYVGDDYGWGSYPTNSQGMVEAACRIADPMVDFSEYDNDGDGYVDGVNVMFAGQFDGTPQTIWPHAWSLPGDGVEFDGVKVSSYSVQNEYDERPGDKSAAVFCHEFGHVLGLPDLYDYDYDANGVGNWCLMSFGVYNGDNWSPAHLSAWCRLSLGITEAVNVTVEGDYEVPSVESSGVIYRLWTNGSSGDEYFLVENRRPIGYDAALPGWGVLVWHIDDSVWSNDNQWYPGYTSSGHYHVALEQADGLWEIEQAIDYGDGGDPFPGSSQRDSFSDRSLPDSRDYDLQSTSVTVGPIPTSADTVTVHMSVGETGIGGGFTHADPSGLALLSPNPSGSSVELLLTHDGGPASVAVFDLAGRRVATLQEGQMESGAHSMIWDASSASPGVYFARYVSEHRSSLLALVLVR